MRTEELQETLESFSDKDLLTAMTVIVSVVAAKGTQDVSVTQLLHAVNQAYSKSQE